MVTVRGGPVAMQSREVTAGGYYLSGSEQLIVFARATAYYHRPWAGPATILTMDGAGDGLCATVAVGDGPDMRRVAATPKI